MLGIWLTTKRLLICWPVVLAADFLYLVVFYQARLVFRCAAADFFCRLHALRLVALVARRARRGRGARGAAERARLDCAVWLAGAVGAVLLGWLMVRLGAALPHLDAALTSYSLVASWWQARKHIANWWLWIAVDADLHRRVHLQGSVGDGAALRRPGAAGRVGAARLAAQPRTVQTAA